MNANSQEKIEFTQDAISDILFPKINLDDLSSILSFNIGDEKIVQSYTIPNYEPICVYKPIPLGKVNDLIGTIIRIRIANETIDEMLNIVSLLKENKIPENKITSFLLPTYREINFDFKEKSISGSLKFWKVIEDLYSQLLKSSDIKNVLTLHNQYLKAKGKKGLRLKPIIITDPIIHRYLSLSSFEENIVKPSLSLKIQNKIIVTVSIDGTTDKNDLTPFAPGYLLYFTDFLLENEDSYIFNSRYTLLRNHAIYGLINVAL